MGFADKLKYCVGHRSKFGQRCLSGRRKKWIQTVLGTGNNRARMSQPMVTVFYHDPSIPTIAYLSEFNSLPVNGAKDQLNPFHSSPVNGALGYDQLSSSRF